MDVRKRCEIQQDHRGISGLRKRTVRSLNHESPRLLGSKFGCGDNRGVGQTGVAESVLVPGGGDGGRISVHVVHLDVWHQVHQRGGFRWPRDADRWGTVHDQRRRCGHNRLVRAIIKGDQGVPKVVSCQRICGERKAARSCGLFNIVEMPSHIDHLNIVSVGIGG